MCVGFAWVGVYVCVCVHLYICVWTIFLLLMSVSAINKLFRGNNSFDN